MARDLDAAAYGAFIELIERAAYTTSVVSGHGDVLRVASGIRSFPADTSKGAVTVAE